VGKVGIFSKLCIFSAHFLYTNVQKSFVVFVNHIGEKNIYMTCALRTIINNAENMLTKLDTQEFDKCSDI
jgi:hypothetical protein